MKNKKWIITVTAVVILALCICACGKKITLDEAQDIALKDAGLTLSDTNSLSAMETSGSYMISFTSEQGMYSYQISGKGEILGRTMDLPAETTTEGSVALPAEVESAIVPDPTAEPTAEPAKETAKDEKYIGEDKAYAIVLKKLGVNENQVTKKKIELDKEDGIMVYDGEVVVDGVEYDFEVNAETGEIVKLKIDD